MSDTNGWDIARDVVTRILDWRFLVFVAALLIGLGLLDAGPLAKLTDTVVQILRAAR